MLKEDALEAFHRDGTTLRLRHQNGALERADDEACEVLYVGVRGEHRGDASANRLAFLAGFRAEVSVQAPSTHVVLAKVLELPFHPRTQPAKRRQPVIP